MTSYFHNLVAKLTEGLAKAPAIFKERQARYLARKQNKDGGFSGREGKSDLYYTGYALRGLAVLDALAPATRQRAAEFVQGHVSSEGDVVDLYSLLVSLRLLQTAGGPDSLAQSGPDWLDRVAAALEKLRAADGGYGKAPGASSSSMYHAFLAALCYEILGKVMPQPDKLLDFVRSRRREDGGYAEGSTGHSATVATGAAVGILHILQGDRVDQQETAPAIAFLAQMHSVEGGLRANASTRPADLLSTFGGCWTLSQLGGLDRIDVAEARAYVRSLEAEHGGFKGGLWDTDVDGEYTFYGLGTIAVLGY